MIDENTNKTNYRANLSNGLPSYDGDVELQLYARLLGIATDCNRCLEEQKYGRYPFSMPFQDKVIIELQNIEVGTVRYDSPELRKGIKEARPACILGNCKYANPILNKMFEDNEKEIQKIKKKQLEEKTKKRNE